MQHQTFLLPNPVTTLIKQFIECCTITFQFIGKFILNDDMRCTNDMKTEYYDPLSQFFHWVMAVVIIYASIAGFGMHLVEDNHPLHSFCSILNMSLATMGALIFIARYVWKYFRQPPQLPDSMSRRHKAAVKLSHSLLYVTMAVVFISGFLMLKEDYSFFWLFKIPNPITNPDINAFFLVIHRAACISLSALFTLHIFAVLKHHFFGRDNVLRSMMPRSLRSKKQA